MPLKFLSPRKKNVKIVLNDNDSEDVKKEKESTINTVPSSIPEVFRTQTLLDKTLKNEILFDSIIEKKMIGLLFSASWCPPNEEFISQLKSIYKETKEKNVNFEIIYVPFDDTLELCNQNYVNNHGNWLLWPFDSPLLKDLRQFYQVDYLPKMIIIKSNFDVLAFNARRDLKERGITVFSNWGFIWKKSKTTQV